MIVILVFAVFILTAIGAHLYVFTRMREFAWVKELAGESKAKSRLIRAPFVLAMALWCVFDLVPAVIAVVHLLFFWLVSDFAGWIVKKTSKKEFRFYWQGAVALVVTAVYLICGWYFAHHVYETDYTLATAKNLPGGHLRVAVIADSHIGCTFDGEGFAAHMKEIEQSHPDLLLIVGDFVDDDTKRADMEKACAALGEMKTTYGIYYVYGNHDPGYSDSRDFTAADMEAELEKNHVTVLKDESVLLADSVYVVGRRDRSSGDRLSMKDLTKELDLAKYMIVLDHQPHDFAAQEAAGADLVLCGHTHGGQMFPIGITGELSGANEKTYGLETRGNTNYIVTSGISDWAIPYKTAAIAEYVIIDIR